MSMLLPDNIHPEQSIYYNGAFVLEALREQSATDILDLYLHTQVRHQMTMPVFILCLDWLYLLDVVSLNEQGDLQLCS